MRSASESFLIQQFERIVHKEAFHDELSSALAFLVECLFECHQKEVIVLVDEYDTPIHNGYTYNYYDEIILFMRTFLGAAFKDNVHLKRGVLTGILRISKESIFSDLNNIGVYTLLEEEFSTHFGLTTSEVEDTLACFSVSDPQGVKDWYNGYLCGATVLYNPWSLLSFLAHRQKLGSYWVNTSSNDLAREMILQLPASLHEDVETLLAGGTIVTRLRNDLVLRDLPKSPFAIWNLLVFSGYLKPAVIEITLRASCGEAFSFQRAAPCGMKGPFGTPKPNGTLKRFVGWFGSNF